MITETGAALRRQLDEALEALASGDAADAERRAKAVSALVKAERDVAELAAATPANAEQDEESRRAELRRRIALFVAASEAGAPDEELDDIAAGRSAQ